MSSIDTLRLFIREAIDRKAYENVPRYVYHVTTKPNTARSIVAHGFEPMSKGSKFYSEDAGDKTYAYVDPVSAAGYLDEMLGNVQDEVGYHSWDAYDYPYAMLRIDTTHVKPWFYDEESDGFGSDWVFTTSKIPPEALSIVPINKIINVLQKKFWPSMGWSRDAIDKIPLPNDEF